MPNKTASTYTMVRALSTHTLYVCLGTHLRCSEQGCQWNMPANYDSGKFESCKADNDLPMGVYGTSTWYVHTCRASCTLPNTVSHRHQGQGTAPPAHPAASSSECKSYPTISSTHVKRDINQERMIKRAIDPRITAAPLAF